MKRNNIKILTWILLSFILSTGLYSQSTAEINDIFLKTNTNSSDLIQNQQITIEENKGQITGKESSEVKYFVRDKGFTAFLLSDGISYQFYSSNSLWGVETYRMDLILEDVNTEALITTEGKSNDYTHYYTNDVYDVHNYDKIIYHDVYPNIDWVFYKAENTLKYDFIIHPGGDPNLIKLQMKWVEESKINADGSLSLKNRLGEIKEQSPVSYQGEKIVNTNFQIEENIISFRLGEYDSKKVLRIDPSLIWSIYHGGNSMDLISSCVTDDIGNLYVSGDTQINNGFLKGGFDNSYVGVMDAFITKYSSEGEKLWTILYGGEGIDVSESLVMDEFKNIYMTGLTESLIHIDYKGFQNENGGESDAYLVKFDSTGSIQWSTYYGGSGRDAGRSCSLDKNGNIYMAGNTKSSQNISFNGHQDKFGGAEDAFLVKFDSEGKPKWATYYGGSSNDSGSACSVDSKGNIYLSGHSNSEYGIASGGFQNELSGKGDGFLTKLDSNGRVQWSTYIGGKQDDFCFDIEIDKFNNVYITGNTESTTNISQNGHQNSIGGNRDSFLFKFTSMGKLEWSTYYGGENEDYGSACKIDENGNIFLIGSTASLSGISYNGYQDIYGGGYRDAFVAKFNPKGVRLWGSYFGGKKEDNGGDISFSKKNVFYIVGDTKSEDIFSKDGYQNLLRGDYDGYVAKFFYNK